MSVQVSLSTHMYVLYKQWIDFSPLWYFGLVLTVIECLTSELWVSTTFLGGYLQLAT